MVVSKVRTRNNDDMVSLYIPMLSGYLPDEAISMLKEVKAAKKGGGKMHLGDFLRPPAQIPKSAHQIAFHVVVFSR